MPQITIDINANASELKKQIAEAEIELKGLRKEMNRKFSLGEVDAAEKIQLEVNQAKTALKGLQAELVNTSKAQNSMTKSTVNGGNALTQMSRIVQDSPFGAMGMANNFTASGEALGDLVEQTGSFGEALKAVGSSLAGFGGVMLVVSAVSAGLTYMAQNGITVSDVVDKMTGDFDELANSMREVNSQAIKDSGAEVANLKALTEASKNTALSMNDRLIAVNKLQSQYPAYFGNLSKEDILNGKVTSAVKEVTKAIIAKARAQVYASKIAENEALIFDLQEKGQRMAKQFANKGGFFGLMAGSSGAQLFTSQANSISKEIDDLIAKNKKFTEELNKDASAYLKLDTPKPSKAKAKAKTEKTELKSKIIPFKTTIQATDLVDVQGIEVFNGQVDQFGNKIKELPGVIKTGLVVARNEFDYGSLAMIEAMYEFNKSANQLIKGAIADTFVSLGETIGGALSGAGDGLKSAGSAILGILGDFMKDYGKLMISTGVGLLVAEQALKSGNPYAMIAGGVALVAVGSVFASNSKKMQSKGLSGDSGNGSVSSNSGASQQSGGSSFGSSGGSFNSGGTVVFEIAGNKLIGVLRNTLDVNKRLGGALTI